MNDFVGITVLAVAEGILGEAVVTVFRVRVQGACSGQNERIRRSNKIYLWPYGCCAITLRTIKN